LQADVNAQAAKLRELRGTKRDVMLPYVNTTHRVPDEVQQQVAQLDADIATLQAEYTANKSELGAAQQRVAKESEKQSSKAVASRQAKLVAEIKADKKLIDDIENGLREIERRRSTFDADMAARLGALKAKDYALVLKDIQMVVEASRPNPVKVILETSQLSLEEKIVACGLSKAAGAHFVKTSTGFGGGGATAEDIALMRKVVGEDVGVKASGGVRSSEDAMAMIQAGANRIGASASIAIVTGGKSTSKY
jgi:deoxyribose-phosphate aldolase